MIILIAILWLLALVYTIRKRSKQIMNIEGQLKQHNYEQKSKEGESQETEKESSEVKPS